jgi:hypothetical protein
MLISGMSQQTISWKQIILWHIKLSFSHKDITRHVQIQPNMEWQHKNQLRAQGVAQVVEYLSDKREAEFKPQYCKKKKKKDPLRQQC